MHTPEWLVGATALSLLTLVNCLGVKTGGRTQSVLMVMKIVAIAALATAGLALTLPQRTIATAAQRASSLASFGAAMVPVLFAYGGWQTANFIAAEVKQPERNLPRALLMGVAGVIVLYTTVNWVCLRALGARELSATTVPASAIMRLALGDRGATLISAAIAISTLGFLSQSILTAPRVYFAMAEDGLFFRQVARVDRHTHVPVVAIMLQSGWTIVIALSGRYEQILNYVVSMDFLFYALTASTLFVFRRRQETDPAQPITRYRVPGHPVTTAVFVAICCWIVGNTIYRYPQNTLIGIGFLFAGLPVYWLWSRALRRTDCDQERNA
jgi:APA family basic amino acid/polyamine antiporter